MEITAILVYPPCFFHPLHWPDAATAHARGTIAWSAKVRNRWKYITSLPVWQGFRAHFLRSLSVALQYILDSEEKKDET